MRKSIDVLKSDCDEIFHKISRQKTINSVDLDLFDELYIFENKVASDIIHALQEKGWNVGDVLDDMQGESTTYARGLGFEWNRDDYPIAVVEDAYELWAVFRHGYTGNSPYRVWLDEIRVVRRE